MPVFCFVLALAQPAPADVIDRIAVSVGTAVITTSDIDRELRVTAFLNSEKPGFGPAAKREAAERMVERTLVRRELELSRYPLPEPSAAEPLFDQLRKEHQRSDAEFQSALAGDGVTEQDVRDELYWQLTLLRFIEIRFRPGVQVTDQDIQDYFEKTVRPAAQAAHPGEEVTLDDYRQQIEETLTGQRADKELDNWLKEARRRVEIVFHEEAFQ